MLSAFYLPPACAWGFRSGVGGPQRLFFDGMAWTSSFKAEALAWLSKRQDLLTKRQFADQTPLGLIGFHHRAIVAAQQLGVIALTCVIRQITLNVEADMNDAFRHFAILQPGFRQRNGPLVLARAGGNA